MNEQFKNKQNEVALRYGFQSWSAIKWFELQQSFEHDKIKVPAFDVLLEEVVREFQEEVYNAGFDDGFKSAGGGKITVTGTLAVETISGTVKGIPEDATVSDTVDLVPTVTTKPESKRKKKEDNNG
jgi:hypothetical protein